MVNAADFDRIASVLATASSQYAAHRDQPAIWKPQLSGLAAMAGSVQSSSSNAGLAQRLLNENGPQRVIVLLEGIALEAAQTAQGMDDPDFSKWRRDLTEAKAAYASLTAVTPAQSQANLGPLQTRQTQLQQRIQSLSIGGRGSVTGALIGTSLEPLQSEWVAIMQLIQRAIITPAHRTLLMNKQGELRSLLEGKTIQASREGADVGQALDNMQKAMDDAAREARCYLTGTKFEKLKCFLGGDAKWFVIAGSAVGLVVLLALLQPYIIAFAMATRGKKKSKKKSK